MLGNIALWMNAHLKFALVQVLAVQLKVWNTNELVANLKPRQPLMATSCINRAQLGTFDYKQAVSSAQLQLI